MANGEALKGYNDLMILSILAEGDSYGYSISKTIRERTCDQYLIKETTLYSVFGRLEKNGCIKSYYGEQTFGKRRTYYSITPAGLDYYQKKCAEWKETLSIIGSFIREA